MPYNQSDAATVVNARTPQPAHERPTVTEKTSQKVTMSLDVYNELRDAVAYFRAHPELGEPRAIGKLIEQAARHELTRLRDEHRKGAGWPQRDGALPVGRLEAKPIKKVSIPAAAKAQNHAST